jgi:hypothetical protein
MRIKDLGTKFSAAGEQQQNGPAQQSPGQSDTITRYRSGVAMDKVGLSTEEQQMYHQRQIKEPMYQSRITRWTDT